MAESSSDAGAGGTTPSIDRWRLEYATATATLGERLLSAPWTDSTLRARNLMLTTSAAGAVLLAGSTPPELAQVKTVFGSAIMVSFAAATLLYAFVAFATGVINDLERHRLLTIRPVQDYIDQLKALETTRTTLIEQLKAGSAPPPEIVEAMEQRAAATAEMEKVEEDYINLAPGSAPKMVAARARRVEAATKIDQWEAAQRRTREVATAELAMSLRAPEYIDAISAKLFPKTKWQYRFQTWVEAIGPGFIGLAVFLPLVVKLIKVW